jgi:hypothetical protein
MKLRHFLYDLTDVLVLHLILNVPGVVVELLSLSAHWPLICYILGIAWAITQLILGDIYRDKLLAWWEKLPSFAVWSITSVTVVLFLSGLVEEIMVHGWK